MAEPEAASKHRRTTPDPPQAPAEIARKIKRDARHRPLPDKAKVAASELYREVSGDYEAKQEREAGRPRRADEGRR